MEIKINKEIRTYRETLFFGLSVRQFVCSVLAVGVAVALYFALSQVLDRETVSWVCIVGAAPVAAAGFFQYNGLTLEQFLWAWLKSEVIMAGKRVWNYEEAMKREVKKHQFDSFCRKVLREEARDYERHIAWRSDHEVSLSELSEEQERQMYVLDEYPSEQTHFHVQGYDVAIENEDLANALTVLPDDKRDIVLLAYFLDMTNQEIADKLDMVRRTVQYKRAQSLKELKKEMEVTEDGTQSE